MKKGKTSKNFEGNFPKTWGLIVIGMIPFFLPFTKAVKSGSLFRKNLRSSGGGEQPSKSIILMSSTGSSSGSTNGSGTNGGWWSWVKNPWFSGPAAGAFLVIVLPLIFTVFNTIFKIISSLFLLSSLAVGGYFVYKKWGNGSSS